MPRLVDGWFDATRDGALTRVDSDDHARALAISSCTRTNTRTRAYLRSMPTDMPSTTTRPRHGIGQCPPVSEPVKSQWTVRSIPWPEYETLEAQFLHVWIAGRCKWFYSAGEFSSAHQLSSRSPSSHVNKRAKFIPATLSDPVHFVSSPSVHWQWQACAFSLSV